MKKSRCALFLAFAMSLRTVAFGSDVYAASENVIHISTVDELVDFAKRAHHDRWSRGKTVILDNDIKMPDDIDIVIPSFAGVFDGNGHTISNVNVSEAASNTGFFGLILEEGRVSNLKVEGKYKPKEIMSRLGGIAGTNYGMVENCSYSGKIKADRELGGIVGYNMPTGTVTGCSFDGSITGNVSCGGIVGYNEGRVVSCTNNGNVNITYKDKSVTQEELSDTIESIIMGESLKYLRGFHTRMDVGGVVGFSSGEISSCFNKGTVGYDHVGYNTGGIVGRSTGFVKECNNSGSIYGRKDVGGIVGQQQPYIIMDFTESDLEELHGQVKTLNGLINNALTSASGHTTATANNLLGISGMTDQAIDDIDSLAQRASEGADELSDTASASIDLGRLAVDNADEYIDNVMDAVDDLADEVERKEAQLGLSAMELDAFNASISDARAALRSTKDVLLEFSELDPVGALGLKDRTVAVPDVQKMANSFRTMTDQLQELLLSISFLADGRLAGVGRDVEDAVEDDPGFYENAMDILDSFDQFNKNASELNRDLRDKGTDLYGTMGQITDEINRSINDANSNIQGTISQLQQIRSQSDRISDKMNDMLKKASDPDTYTSDDKREDVSSVDIESATDGRTSHSRNTGSIDADYNVGGITGMMGFEMDLDPEDDIEERGERSFQYVMREKCIIDGSTNEGSVHSNRNSSGGIVGNMELGLVISGENYGDVKSDEDYAGGICGYSVGEIADSYTKQYISASRYVGGIAGYGKVIHNCASMPNMGESEQYIGAIAGNVKDINREDVHDNRYYARGMYGIDGVSYTGIAEGISYGKLMGIEGIPARFNTLVLTFVYNEDEDDEDEETVVGTVECKYGQSVVSDDIPDVPVKEGFTGRWSKKAYSSITRDEVIKAKYSRVVTLIESDKKGENDLPVLFAEGSFARGDVLGVKDLKEADSTDDFVYSVEVPDDGSESHTFRYMPSKKDQDVRIFVSGENGKGSRMAKTGRMGEYVTFEASGSSFRISVDEEWNKRMDVIAAVAAAIALTALIIFVIRFKKGKIILQRLIRYVNEKRNKDLPG